MMIIFACVYWVLYHTWGRQTCLTFSRSYLPSFLDTTYMLELTRASANASCVLHKMSTPWNPLYGRATNTTLGFLQIPLPAQWSLPFASPPYTTRSLMYIPWVSQNDLALTDFVGATPSEDEAWVGRWQGDNGGAPSWDSIAFVNGTFAGLPLHTVYEDLVR